VELGTATPYQRVSSIYDVTEAGVPSCSYLFFDGGSDSMATGNIDFTATDKMTVFAGVRKLSDAGSGIVAELSANTSTNNGAFYLACGDAAGRLWSFAPKGTLINAIGISVAAPDTAVLTGTADIAGDLTVIRRNGVVGATSSADLGTGTFGNHALNIGARSGGTVLLNGNLFGFIVRGAASTTAQITATEAWLAPKTGVVLP
jgi:hypothetical protein